MCIPYTPKHAHPVTSKPALMHFVDLRWLIISSNNLLDLDLVQKEMEIAEMEYPESEWTGYATDLAKLHNGRRNQIARELPQPS